MAAPPVSRETDVQQVIAFDRDSDFAADLLDVIGELSHVQRGGLLCFAPCQVTDVDVGHFGPLAFLDLDTVVQEIERGPDGLLCDGGKPDGEATNLVLVWREFGGPSVASEVQSSYGTNLILNLIPHELGGKVDLMFASQGVSCRIEVPIGRA